MIPPFDENGCLPPGVHGATIEEVAERFGQGSELRRVEIESLRWLVDLARQAGVPRIVVNGSFVTDLLEPNDVDCVLLVGPDFQPNDPKNRELLAECRLSPCKLLTRRALISSSMSFLPPTATRFPKA
jgi:hypothetical protein